MSHAERQKRSARMLGVVLRKPFRMLEESLIKTEYLQPGETHLLIVQPAVEGLSLVTWAASNQAYIETELQRHGAVLFRGFSVHSVSAFERFAVAICPELFDQYGDLPRAHESGKVYQSTPYPPNQTILFHNEASHTYQWPMKIWFFCMQAAQQEGETPIVDCRKIYEGIDPKIRERFRHKKVRYVRNFSEGLDVSWQAFFRTADRSAVETYCRHAGIAFEWKENTHLKTSEVRAALAQHPTTGEMVWFNQLQLHHVSTLNLEVREFLRSTFKEDDLPRNVYYGDGSPIEDSIMEEIGAVYRTTAVSFPWQEGDILLLDNMLTAHGRNPFVGPRKIVVAMGDMMTDADLALVEQACE